MLVALRKELLLGAFDPTALWAAGYPARDRYGIVWAYQNSNPAVLHARVFGRAPFARRPYHCDRG